jgi:tetrahydromethanopterin S-methyltransferase subunit A
MSNKAIDKIKIELQKGMKLSKCKKCGCMKESLEAIQSFSFKEEGLSDLMQEIGSWRKQMEQIKYACLGCEHCYPAIAMNIFTQEFPDAAEKEIGGCQFEIRDRTWPPVAGEYSSFCDGNDSTCPVAVTTLASAGLAEELAKCRPKELCIVGKTETENIGIDKIVKNIITNPGIRILFLAGKDPKGHQAGDTLLMLWENGVDEKMRVIGSHGKRPVLKNVTREEVETFRRQVEIVNMIGCDDADAIIRKIKGFSRKDIFPKRSCRWKQEKLEALSIPSQDTIKAKEAAKVEMDKAGYFVIIPQPPKGIITVEHYSYDNRLQRTIEGKDAKSIYSTIIENNWITVLSHAAYLGKELEKAQISIQCGFKYIQDGA